MCVQYLLSSARLPLATAPLAAAGLRASRLRLHALLLLLLVRALAAARILRVLCAARGLASRGDGRGGGRRRAQVRVEELVARAAGSTRRTARTRRLSRGRAGRGGGGGRGVEQELVAQENLVVDEQLGARPDLLALLLHERLHERQQHRGHAGERTWDPRGPLSESRVLSQVLWFSELKHISPLPIPIFVR